MKTWYNCKVKYQKQEDSGRYKTAVDHYLVDANSYTEAEARIYEELGSIIIGEFIITSITKSKIVDLFEYEDTDVWYKCKVSYTTVSEGGQEKKVAHYMLVTACNVEQAYLRLVQSLDNMLVSFTIPEVIETQIVEVFPYIPEY